MWTTISDKSGKEYLTTVHQVDCRNQFFCEKKKQFVCRIDGEFCDERCEFYSGLNNYLSDYEDIPIAGVDSNFIQVRVHAPEKESETSDTDSLDLVDDYELMNYLRNM